MKTYIEKSTGNQLAGDHVLGKWGDGSEKTVEEVYKLNPEKEFMLQFNHGAARKAEIFELACRLMVGHAQAGIKPNPSDALEVAKEAYNLKDKL